MQFMQVAVLWICLLLCLCFAFSMVLFKQLAKALIRLCDAQADLRLCWLHIPYGYTELICFYLPFQIGCF